MTFDRSAYGAEWYAQNRERVLARQREQRQKAGEEFLVRQRGYQAKFRHGASIVEDYARMWQEQDGCCYLCGAELAERKVHIDHDHACCPRGHSCRACRRGLTCGQCNQLIGLADDDPARLRRIADALEMAQLATTADRHEQIPLLPAENGAHDA